MNNKTLTSLLYGWIIVLALMVIASVILATFLSFTPFNDPSLSWITLIIGLTSLFIGGVVAGLKNKQKGWMIGSLTGLGFTLFVFIVQYLGYSNSFSFGQLLHHGGFILAAMFGGVFGVNIFSKEN